GSNDVQAPEGALRLHQTALRQGIEVLAGGGGVAGLQRRLGARPKRFVGRRVGQGGSREEERRQQQPAHRRPDQNALKVMMVKVSFPPGRRCTRSVTKWPMSRLSSR